MITSFTTPSDRLGDIRLIGRHGGAICQHYRVIAIDTATQTTTLEAVTSRSVRNDDGTFST